MDVDKLFKLVNNFTKRRENYLRMPEAQKKTVKPAYDKSKEDLEAEINSIIDERITDKMSLAAGIGIETDPTPAVITEDPGSAETKEDDTKPADNKNTAASEPAPGDDDKTPEIF